MNSLDTQLRLSLEMPDVCLDRPVVDIVNRGKRLKRRRRLALAAGASATALVVVTSTALLSFRTEPPAQEAISDLPSGVMAGWNGPPLSMSAGDLAEVTAECGRRGQADGGPARIMADSAPLAADRLGTSAIVMWKGLRHWVTCTPRLDGATWRADQAQAVQTWPLSVGQPTRIAMVELDLSAGSKDDSGQPVQSSVLEVGWVRADVDRLVIDTTSSLVEATIIGDRFIAWLPAEEPFVTQLDNGSRTDATVLTLSGYDSEGRLIGETAGW